MENEREPMCSDQVRGDSAGSGTVTTVQGVGLCYYSAGSGTVLLQCREWDCTTVKGVGLCYYSEGSGTVLLQCREWDCYYSAGSGTVTTVQGVDCVTTVQGVDCYYSAGSGLLLQ